MEKERKNIFISHYGGDEKYVEPFKKLLSSKINAYDSSVVESEPNNAANADYIKYQILAPKIKWAGTFVVLIGEETQYRDYVNWEIEYAIKNDKRIIGVYLPGADKDDVPEALEKYGDSLVTWDKTKVIGAMQGGTEWDTPNGDPRPKVQFRGEC